MEQYFVVNMILTSSSLFLWKPVKLKERMNSRWPEAAGWLDALPG